MRERTLAGGLALTELGLGTSQFGNLYREATDAECAAAVDAAWDAGVRYFDTAPHYGIGLSERRLGALLRARPRDEYVLSTKVGRLLEPTPERAHEQDPEFVVPAASRRRWDFSADGVRRSVEESLARLGLDRIDIAYVHDPDDFGDEAIAEAFPALVRMRDEGLVRAIGAGMNQAAMLARFIREADVDVVMVAGRLTLLDQSALDELVPLAAERGVGIVAAGVYNSGLLSSATVSADARFDYVQAPPEVIARARAIAEVCRRHGVSLPEAAVAFPLRHPAVVSVVLGARNAEQARGNVERYTADVSEALWVELADAGLAPAASVH